MSVHPDNLRGLAFAVRMCAGKACDYKKGERDSSEKHDALSAIQEDLQMIAVRLEELAIGNSGRR